MPPELSPEEYLETSESVRTGEYFREAGNIYDNIAHDPMSERYFYVLITVLASIILIIALMAMQNLYPLTRSIPFIVSSDNMTEDMPQIRSLLVQPGQDPSMALLEFMIGNYVKNREEYDIEKFDRNMNGIKTQSTQEVFDEYQNYVDPRNPESPITRYQRHSIKKVQILSTNYYEADDEKTMEVLYEAEVESKNSLKKSRWQAKISFIYSGIELDESKGEISPLTFIVTRYETKRLQDIQ